MGNLFTHKMDPLVRIELDMLVSRVRDFEQASSNRIAVLMDEIAKTNADVVSIEQKMDEILKLLDDHGSIKSGETPKPEPLGVMPGHTPWSQRKKQREAESRSPKFIDKVTKGAAITEKPDGN